MGRPRKATRPVEKSISLPETLCVRVDLLLWSELEERVPTGAWARYVQELIETDLALRNADQRAVRQLLEARYDQK